MNLKQPIASLRKSELRMEAAPKKPASRKPKKAGRVPHKPASSKSCGAKKKPRKAYRSNFKMSLA